MQKDRPLSKKHTSKDDNTGGRGKARAAVVEGVIGVVGELLNAFLSKKKHTTECYKVAVGAAEYTNSADDCNNPIRLKKREGHGMNSKRYGVAVAIGLWAASTGPAQALHIKIKVRVPDIHHPLKPPVEVTVTGVSSKPIFNQAIQKALEIRIPNMPSVHTTEEELTRLGLGMKAYCVKYRDPAMEHQPSDSSQSWNPPNPGGTPQAGPAPYGPNPGAPWKKENFHSRLGAELVRERVDLNVGDGNVEWVHPKGCEAPENQG